MYKIKSLHGNQQGQEFVEIELDTGELKTINIHDYATLYQYPHFYEYLLVDRLDYQNPTVLGQVLTQVKNISQWRILDVACGSGLMGKYLKKQSSLAIDTLVGIDILPSAIAALERDNFGFYDYACTLENYNKQKMQQYNFNCLLVSGGAIHLSVKDYQFYTNLLTNSETVCIAFTLKLDPQNIHRQEILQWMDEHFHCLHQQIYNHRKLMNGTLIQNEAFIYQK